MGLIATRSARIEAADRRRAVAARGTRASCFDQTRRSSLTLSVVAREHAPPDLADCSSRQCSRTGSGSRRSCGWRSSTRREPAPNSRARAGARRPKILRNDRAVADAARACWAELAPHSDGYHRVPLTDALNRRGRSRARRTRGASTADTHFDRLTGRSPSKVSSSQDVPTAPASPKRTEGIKPPRPTGHRPRRAWERAGAYNRSRARGASRSPLSRRLGRASDARCLRLAMIVSAWVR